MDSTATSPDRGDEEKKDFHPLVKRPDAPIAMLGAIGGSVGAAGMVNAGILTASQGLFLQLGVTITASLALHALVKPPTQRRQYYNGMSALFRGVEQGQFQVGFVFCCWVNKEARAS